MLIAPFGSAGSQAPRPAEIPLGKPAIYIAHYTPALLVPIARKTQRLTLPWFAQKESHPPQNTEAGNPESASSSSIADSRSSSALTLPFSGADSWTAYELSWLNPRGKPCVALLRFSVPAESPNLVESKSVKLYLNSFNQSVFKDAAAVGAAIQQDLSLAVGMQVSVQITLPEDFAREQFQQLDGLLLDRLDIACTQYQPAPELLTVKGGADATNANEATVEETLVSHLLKSNCLVTGQPDWGDIQIRYSGRPIQQEGLLQYLVSLREHHEFHEHCVERIFLDIWQRCKPDRLQVLARFTRRGGIDINPFRTSHPCVMPKLQRGSRQ